MPEHPTVFLYSLALYMLDLTLFIVLVFVQSQQPLEDLDAQLRRTLSPETIAVTSTVGVSFENLDIFP